MPTFSAGTSAKRLRHLLNVGGLQAISVLSSLIILAVMGQKSSASAVGDFAFVTALAFLVANVSTFGFGHAALSRYARLVVSPWGANAIKHQMRQSAELVIIFGAVCSLLVALILYFLDQSSAMVLGAILWTWLATILMYLSDQARALNKVGLAAWISSGGVGVSPLASLSSLLSVSIFSSNTLPLEAVALWSLNLGGILVLCFSAHRILGNPVDFFSIKSKYKKAYLLKNSWPFAIGRFAPAYQSGDVVLIGLLLPADITGIYAAASRLAATLNFPMTVVVKVFSPEIAKHWARNYFKQLKKTLTFATVTSAIAVSSMAIPLIAFPETVLEALFGPTYKEASALLGILILGRLISGFCGPMGATMTAMGYGKPLAASVLITATLAFLVGSLATLLYGVMGTAIVFATALIGQNVYQLMFVTNRLRRQSVKCGE